MKGLLIANQNPDKDCCLYMEIANEINVLSVRTTEISVYFSMSFWCEKQGKERDKILIIIYNAS